MALFGLLGDQNDPNSSGALGGLLGMFKSPDIQAMYGGDLSNPATQQAFRSRGLDAMAAAFGEGAMPVPYKGGIPLGATLGKAAYAADQGMDSLAAARLQSAQQVLALANAGNAQAQALLRRASVEGFQNFPTGEEGAGAGTGKGGASTAGGPTTGPSKIIASKTADTTLAPEQRALLDTIAGPESNGAYNVRWGSGGDKTFSDFSQHPRIFEPGPQGPSSAAGRYQIVASTWDPLAKKYRYGDFQPATQDQAAWHLAADTYHDKTGRDLQTDLQNGDTSRVESALHGQWSTLRMGSYAGNLKKYTDEPPTQTADAAPAAGGPVAGGGQPATPAGPPMAPPQAKPPGLLTPQGAAAAGASTAVPLAEPPALPPGAAPGPQGLLGPQQGGGEVGSPLGPVAGGPAPMPPMPGGRQFAGPGAADMPSAAPPAQPGGMLPHTGAAGAAELQGLLNQPPPAPAAPVPAGPPPPPAAGPPGPPAPPPGAGPPPPPQAAPAPPDAAPIPGAGPPPPPVVPPPEGIAGQHYSNAQIAWAKKQAALMSVAGETVPTWVNALSTLDTDMTKEAQKQQLDNYYKNAQAQYNAQLEVWKAGPIKAAQLPYTATRVAPGAGVSVGAGPPAWYAPDKTTLQDKNGAYHDWYVTPPTQPGGQPTYTYIGPSKPSAGAVATQTGLAGANVKDFETVQNEAKAAAQSLAQATFMRQEAPNFHTGPGAHEVNFMNRTLVSLGMGGDDAAKSAASYESFIKDAGALARSQAQAISQRVGVQELRAVSAVMPGEENTQRGLDRTLAQIQGLSDYRLLKQQAMTGYMAHPDHAGSNAGFEAEFNKNVSPYTYMYMRMSDADRADIRSQLSQSSGGRADLQRLQEQVNYIKANNLLPVQ